MQRIDEQKYTMEIDMKNKVREQTKIWGPRIAFFAVFGFTGLAAIGLYKGYKLIRGVDDADFEITEEDWRRGQS
jgi:hypothetical protein